MKRILNLILVIFAVFGMISCASSIINKVENSSNKTDENIVEETNVDFSQMRYLAFGDSITAGDGLSNIENSYPYMVADILGCNVRNKGVGGSSLVYASDRRCIADDVVSVSKGTGIYDIISATGGTNDRSLSHPLGNIDDRTNETIYGSLHIIAITLKTNYSNAFIFFMTPIKNKLSEVDCANGYNLEDVSNAIKEVASIYDIPVLDLYNTSQFENVDCGMNASDCDGTHPTKEYIEDYMAPQIANFIKDNYK